MGWRSDRPRADLGRLRPWVSGAPWTRLGTVGGAGTWLPSDPTAQGPAQKQAQGTFPTSTRAPRPLQSSAPGAGTRAQGRGSPGTGEERGLRALPALSKLWVGALWQGRMVALSSPVLDTPEPRAWGSPCQLPQGRGDTSETGSWRGPGMTWAGGHAEQGSGSTWLGCGLLPGPLGDKLAPLLNPRWGSSRTSL